MCFIFFTKGLIGSKIEVISNKETKKDENQVSMQPEKFALAPIFSSYNENDI
jgi:hypothetical protein